MDEFSRPRPAEPLHPPGEGRSGRTAVRRLAIAVVLPFYLARLVVAGLPRRIRAGFELVQRLVALSGRFAAALLRALGRAFEAAWAVLGRSPPS